MIPLLLINNEFISNFKTKANYFNRFFNQQCTAISTDSSIPSSVNLATNKTVTKINFDEQLISKLVVALNPNKAHDHDGLSILMLQIPKTLSILFWNCLEDAVPVHKKTSKFWIIIDLFPSYLFVVNYLRKSFLIQIFNT